MDSSDRRNTSPFRRKLERWRAVGGGIDEDGNVVKEPWTLMKVRMIDNLCQRYSCLPSQLLTEDISLLFEIHNVMALAGDHESQEHQQLSPEQSMAQNLANLSTSM